MVEEQDNTGALQASYVYGRYIDEPIQMERGGNAVYYHSDDLYNVTALTNATGEVVERYRYDDFGTPHVYTGSGDAIGASAFGNPYLFTGRAWDGDLGLYDYRTRHLQPGLGRFTTRDQIGLWGDPLNMGNPYAYVGNAPGMGTDPYGYGVVSDMWNGSWGLDMSGNPPLPNVPLAKPYVPPVPVPATADGGDVIGDFAPRLSGNQVGSVLLNEFHRTLIEATEWGLTGLGFAPFAEVAIPGQLIYAGIEAKQGEYGSAMINILPIGIVSAVGKAERLTISEAKALGGENRGMIWVLEAQGDISKASTQYEASMAGACSDVASKRRIVPGLRFNNPKEGGYNFVRFDGVDPTDATVLIDRKTALTTFPKQQAAIKRAAEALSQNSGYTAVFEFPTQAAANRASGILTDLDMTGVISVRISP